MAASPSTLPNRMELRENYSMYPDCELWDGRHSGAFATELRTPISGTCNIWRIRYPHCRWPLLPCKLGMRIHVENRPGSVFPCEFCDARTLHELACILIEGIQHISVLGDDSVELHFLVKENTLRVRITPEQARVLSGLLVCVNRHAKNKESTEDSTSRMSGARDG